MTTTTSTSGVPLPVGATPGLSNLIGGAGISSTFRRQPVMRGPHGSPGRVLTEKCTSETPFAKRAHVPSRCRRVRASILVSIGRTLPGCCNALRGVHEYNQGCFRSCPADAG